jgi:hypothetical protein
MTSITDFDINKHNNETTNSIKNLTKPLSSFNYYLKEMRINWKNLSEDEKDKYMIEAKTDNQRYAAEKQEIIAKSEEEIILLFNWSKISWYRMIGPAIN